MRMRVRGFFRGLPGTSGAETTTSSGVGNDPGLFHVIKNSDKMMLLGKEARKGGRIVPVESTGGSERRFALLAGNQEERSIRKSGGFWNT